MADSKMEIGRYLSAGAVVASLAFVGLEIRQNTMATRAQTQQQLAEASREFVLTFAENPRLGAAYVDIFRDEDPAAFALSSRPGASYLREDTLAAQFAMFALLRNLENVYVQLQERVVDEDVLARYGWEGSPTFRSDAFGKYWAERREQFDPGFVEAFEQANGLR